MAMPEISPPPPIGTTSVSRSAPPEHFQRDGALPRDHQGIVIGMDEDQSCALPCARANSAASSSVAPEMIDFGVVRRVFSTFTIGVPTGITIMAGMPSRLRVIGDALRMIAGGHRDDAAPPLVRRQANRRLSAPRSLKEAVNCWFSNLSQILQPGDRQRPAPIAFGNDDGSGGSSPPLLRRPPA